MRNIGWHSEDISQHAIQERSVRKVPRHLATHFGAMATGDEEARNEDADTQATEEAEPEHLFCSKSMEVVPDLRSICGLPANPDEDSLLTFRALILPKGKTLHVPDEPGCYATVGPWRMQIALTLVHFVEATQRKAELLLAFADFAMLSKVAKGMFVMSLQLPLKKARNVYEETPRFTTINNVRGFTSINAASQPWATLLPEALKRHPIYAQPQVFTPAAIIQHMRKTLSSRIKVLAASTRLVIAEEVADLARQDKRQAEKQSALFEGRLQQTLSTLADLPPQKYDRRTEERILVVSAEMAGVDWLRTPQRDQLAAGTAEFRATSVAVRRLHHSSPAKAIEPPFAEPPPVSMGAPAVAAVAPAAALAVRQPFPEDDDLVLSSGDEEENDDETPIGQSAALKRARRTPARLEVGEQKAKKPKASTSKASTSTPLPQVTLPTPKKMPSTLY